MGQSCCPSKTTGQRERRMGTLGACSVAPSAASCPTSVPLDLATVMCHPPVSLVLLGLSDIRVPRGFIGLSPGKKKKHDTLHGFAGTERCRGLSCFVPGLPMLKLSASLSLARSALLRVSCSRKACPRRTTRLVVSYASVWCWTEFWLFRKSTLVTFRSLSGRSRVEREKKEEMRRGCWQTGQHRQFSPYQSCVGHENIWVHGDPVRLLIGGPLHEADGTRAKSNATLAPAPGSGAPQLMIQAWETRELRWQ